MDFPLLVMLALSTFALALVIALWSKHKTDEQLRRDEAPHRPRGKERRGNNTTAGA